MSPLRRTRVAGRVFSGRSLLLAVALVVLAAGAACTGADLVAPPPAPPEVPGTAPELPAIGPNGEILVNCSADLVAGRVTCGELAGPTIAAAADLIVGGQNLYVILAAGALVTDVGHVCSGAVNAAKQCLTFPVTVRNLIPQPMGTTDGVTPMPAGLQIFFAGGPTTTSGAGTIAVANAAGTGVFTASGQPYFQYAGATLGADEILTTNETSLGQSWQLEADATVTGFSFQVYVSAPVPRPNGWVELSSVSQGGAPTTTASISHGGTVQLFPTPRNGAGRALTSGELSGGVTFGSANDAVATVDPNTGVVTGVANGFVAITASVIRASGPTITGVVTVTVTNAAPNSVPDAYDVQMGATLVVSTNQGVLANDTDADDPVTALTVTKTVDPTHGVATVNTDGTFTYVPAAGYTGGTDSFSYTVTDGSSTSAAATVTFTVSGRTWWVNGGAAGGHDGRQATPFLTIADAEVVAVAGDTIFTTGGGSSAGATLKASQVVIGQGVPAAITRNLGATPASQAQTITLLATGSATPVNGAVTLATNNTLRGLAISAGSGAAVSGAGFGTLTVSVTNVSATAGPALDLNTGTLAAAFGTLSSSGSATTAVNLSAVAGTLAATGGTLTGATTNTIAVTGGSVSVTYGGAVTKANVGALLSVTGGHTGTLTFNTGTLSATSGTGLQFDNADGTYQFTGTTTLNGGDAGIDIQNGSSGIFTFGSSTAITNPVNEVVRVNASTATLLYSGAFSKTSAGTGISIANNLGTGIIGFDGGSVTKSLATSTGTAVNITGNSSGTSIVFSGDPLAITTTTGVGFNATGGGSLVLSSLGNTIASAGGTALALNGMAVGGGGIRFQSIAANGGGNGLVLSGLLGSGNVTVTGTGGAGSGGTIQNTTSAAVLLTSMGAFSGRVTLGSMSLNGSNAGATGILGTTFGSLELLGSTITTSGAPALNLTTGLLVSGSTLSNITTSGAVNAVTLSDIAGNLAISAGTITGGAGTVWNVAGGTVSITYSGSMSQANATFPLVRVGTGHATGTLLFNTGTLSATNGVGLQFDNADGIYQFTGTTTLNGGDAGVDIMNGSNGTFTFGAGVAITSPSGTAFVVNGSAPSVTYSGNITQTTAALLVDVTNQGSGLNQIIFQTGTLSATNGPGINLNNADGVVAFNGTTTLNGGNAGIDITTGSDGTFTFGTSASITNPSGAAFVVSGSSPAVTYSGAITQATAGQALVDVTNQGASARQITFQVGALNATNGTGINLNNADGTVNFNGPVTLNGGNAHVDVNTGSNGTLNLSNASVSNPGTNAPLRLNAAAENVSWTAGALTLSSAVTPQLVDIQSNSGGTVNIGASLNSTQRGILIANNTAGSYTFSGGTQSISTGANTAVSLTSNTGATIAFTGGALALTTTTGNTFSATGGGTVTVTGTANAVTTTGGVGVNIANTTIGAANITFRSVNANGGSNGILLNATGNTGSLVVAGNGGRCDTGVATCTGGTIQNTTGADGAAAGNGIHLTDARASLSLMRVTGHQNNGVFGTGVRSLTLSQVLFNGTNGGNVASPFFESAVQLVNTNGGVKISNSVLNGGALNALRVENTVGSPVLDSLVLEADTVSSMQGTSGTALFVNLPAGTGDVRLRNNSITFWLDKAIYLLAPSSTNTILARITNNFVSNTNAGAGSGVDGIWVLGGALTYNIQGNTVRQSDGVAITAERVSGTPAMQGTIDGNLIGASGQPNSGSGTGIGISVTHMGSGTTTAKISNNVLRQINGSASGAITTVAGDPLGNTSNGTFNATIVGNNIQESGTAVNNAQHGILLTHGVVSTPSPSSDLGCYDVGGAGVAANSITNFTSGTANNRIRVNERFVGTMRFPGYGGANNDNAALTTYLLGRNTASTTAIVNNVSAGGGGFVNTPASAACPQPATLP